MSQIKTTTTAIMRGNYISDMNAIQRAAEILRKRLQAGMWAPGQRLPSLLQLADMCSVSRSTMWHVLDILKKESLLHAHRGGAIIAGVVGSVLPSSASRGYAWEQVKDRISKEILGGSFLSNEKIPINKMARRYGVAIDTLKKALVQLVEEGLLIREGRRFRHALGSSRKHPGTMVLIATGDAESGVLITDPRTEQVIEAFERECFRLGYQSRCEGFNGRDPRSLLKLQDRIKEIGHVTGIIINLWMDWNETYWRRWIDMLASLSHKDIPVITIDQDGALMFPATLLERPLFRVLRIAGVRAGEMVGQMLLRQGHTRIAFLHPGSSAPWVQSRYAGLLQCCQRIGGAGCTAELYSLDEINDTYDLTLAVLGLDEKSIHSIYRTRLSNDDLRSLTDRLHSKQWQRLKEKLASAPTNHSVQAVARFMTGFAQSTHVPWIYNYMVDAMVHIASNSAGQYFLVPFFSNVLQNSTATAWVCGEDKTALWALEYLQSQGKKVPENISLIGFENWREAREHQMSTYDFNMNGMVQQALLMIADEKILKSKPAISEVDGYVVERRTTRLR
jgi:DNA-binding LacI/PurR family transcriptional regulator/DNA-binding transcriptional regulator YhcF (GntR family)